MSTWDCILGLVALPVIYATLAVSSSPQFSFTQSIRASYSIYLYSLSLMPYFHSTVRIDFSPFPMALSSRTYLLHSKTIIRSKTKFPTYLQGSPKWDNNFCKADPEETHQKALNAQKVPLPAEDPIYGIDGPLVRIWKEAMIASKDAAA
jgi:hypothetical protein